MSAGNPITGYNINNSLRFRSSASAYLSRTPASAGNQTKWTWSGWVKRGSLGTDQALFSVAGSTNTTYFLVKFDTNNCIYVGNYSTNFFITTQVFRDPSAWYHIVIVLDTTQATANNRLVLYVNGSQVTSFSSNNIAAQIAQNSTQGINQAAAHNIGREAQSGAFLLDGYQTEVNFIDGQALTPSSFGATDAVTGQWLPKQYSGTYGTNGFYLKFSDIATTSGSNAGLGKDFSGNGNYWTTNNISVTAGTTYDAMTDSPTLTSTTVANYCTLNPLRYGTGTSSTTTISDGNLKITCSSNAGSVVGTINIPSSGKWYWEAVVPTQTYNFMMVGVIKNQEALANLNAGVGLLSTGYAVYATNGQKYNNSANAAYMAAPAQNTVVTVAYDADTGSLYVGAGGSWANGSGSTNQTWSGAVAAYTGITGDISPAVSFDSGNCIVNFGQRPFTYTPPTGYLALNTYNLPTPTIKAGNKYMDATLYTQNGAASNVVVNEGQFKPDLVWIKCRTTAGTWNNLVDSVRGVSKTVYSNSTSAEGTDNYLSSFNSNGFTLNIGDSGTNNTAGRTQVAWNWQAGQGSTSSNTSGARTSTTSVNATAGFSVVTWTGTGSGSTTIGHGLGVAPAMIIVKDRSLVRSWNVYHKSLGNTSGVNLNATTAASGADAGWWNNTSPTSSIFTVGTYENEASNYVAYCWAEISGFSKAFSYTGNASSDGPFVYCGFRPKFILIKGTATGRNWVLFDSSRNTYNASAALARLKPNTSDAEDGNEQFDFLSNGFKIRNYTFDGNANGETYIGMAFAENPFKNANAR